MRDRPVDVFVLRGLFEVTLMCSDDILRDGALDLSEQIRPLHCVIFPSSGETPQFNR